MSINTRQSLILMLLLASFCRLESSTQVTGTLYSPSMQKDIQYALRIPISYDWYKTRIFPVLYALHGANAPYDTWTVMNPLNNSIDNDYPAIVATFEAELSSYLDRSDSQQFTTFFFEEFVPFVESEYRAGRYPGMRAVTGFSMGGFGAWHYMLEKPGFFSSVSALSPAFDRTITGQEDKNPFTRLPIVAASNTSLPPMYMNCGTEDRFISDQRQMAELLTNLGYDYEAIETQGAGHDWPFWRDTSDDVITFHYQYFQEAPTEWRGSPIVDGSWADTETLGRVSIPLDPWIWVQSSGTWAYVEPEFDETGGWVYFSR